MAARPVNKLAAVDARCATAQGTENSLQNGFTPFALHRRLGRRTARYRLGSFRHTWWRRGWLSGAPGELASLLAACFPGACFPAAAIADSGKTPAGETPSERLIHTHSNGCARGRCSTTRGHCGGHEAAAGGTQGGGRLSSRGLQLSGGGAYSTGIRAAAESSCAHTHSDRQRAHKASTWPHSQGRWRALLPQAGGKLGPAGDTLLQLSSPLPH